MPYNEPLNQQLKSSPPPFGLEFRLARAADAPLLAELMLLRSPLSDPIELVRKCEAEVGFNQTEKRYRVFVATLKAEVLGLCRFYHSAEIPLEKKKFSAPEGFYNMGMIVSPNWRRQGVARFLSEHRLTWLKNEGAHCVYSAVAGDNLSSLRMHRSFGYKIVSELPGFHNVKFESGSGTLFRLEVV